MKQQTKAGFISLIAMLIIGAIASSIALGLLVSGADIQLSSLTRWRSLQARHLVDACSENALWQIRNSVSYTGTGTLTYSFGTCTYTVTSQGGGSRTIQASSTVATIIRKVKILTSQVSPSITVSSWQELGDF